MPRYAQLPSNSIRMLHANFLVSVHSEYWAKLQLLLTQPHSGRLFMAKLPIFVGWKLHGGRRQLRPLAACHIRPGSPGVAMA